MSDPARVVIVDDHPLARYGLRDIMQDCPGVYVIAEASNGVDALTQLMKTGAELVLLDMVLPQLDGLEVLREIRRRFPETKVLMVSAVDDPYAIRDALEGNVDGYLAKQASREEVISAVHQVMAGDFYLHPSVAETLHAARSDPNLTARQREVLRRMAAGDSNKEIAQDLGVAPETVKSHVTDILRKLGCRDRTAAVAKALNDRLI